MRQNQSSKVPTWGRIIGFIFLAVLGIGIAWRAKQMQTQKSNLQADVLHKKEQMLQDALKDTPATDTTADLAIKPKATSVLGQTEDRVYFSGELHPYQEAELSFKIGGQLAKIHVAAGEYVSSQSPLLSLSSEEAKAQQKQAQASVLAAEAQVKIAEDAYQRVKQLSQNQAAVSAQQKLQAQAQVELAQAQLAAAHAGLQLATVQINNHTLRAPFAGYVTHVPAGIGTTVGPGIPLIGLVDHHQFKIYATATMEQGPLLQPHQIVVLNHPVLKQGRIRFISPVLQDSSRRVMFEIIAEPKKQQMIFSRQLIDGYVLTNQRTNHDAQ